MIILVDKLLFSIYYDVMKLLNDNQNVIHAKITLSETEKEKAKFFAKSKGYTFQGWLGSLVRDELKRHNVEVTNNHE